MVSMRVVNTRILHRCFRSIEIDFRAFRAADPIALHGQHALRPAAFELLHAVQQLSPRKR